VLCGPPASGKSSLAAELAERSGWAHFATDVVRKELAGLPGTARGSEEHYTSAFTEKTYGELLARAAAAPGTVVLLDGNFPTVALRAMAAAAARRCGATLIVLHVGVDEATALRRAAARAATGTSVSDADAAVTARRRAQFVQPTRDEGVEVLGLDGARPTTELADHVLAQLLRAGTFQPPQ
jgi:predicted kinase